MKKLLQRMVLGLVLGVGVYAVGAVWLGLRQLGGSLASFDYRLLAPVLALAFANYMLRYLKWALYLRTLRIDVPFSRNVTIFLGGLSMTVTPGKVGELLKSYLLAAGQGEPMSRTMPAVLAERMTDLIALVLLMACGFFSFRRGGMVLLPVGVAVMVFLVVVSSRRLSHLALRLLTTLPGVKRFGDRLDTFYASMAVLFRPRPLAAATLLSLGAWFCECLGTYLVLLGFDGKTPSLLMATFVYSAATLGGLPTPGGIGLTDGGMAALLHLLANVGLATAGAATLLVRLCTLWFAVLVGVVALLAYRRNVGLADEVVHELG